MVENWIVDRYTARNFTVVTICPLSLPSRSSRYPQLIGPDLSLKSILANYVTLIFANKTSLSIVKRLNAYINYRWWWSRGDWLPLVWGQISSWLFRACLFLLSYHAVDDVAVSLSENKDSKNSYISPHSQTNQRLYINNTQSMPMSLRPYGYAWRKYFFQLANLTALHIEFFLRQFFG